jgi:hypothetical protein
VLFLAKLEKIGGTGEENWRISALNADDFPANLL